MGILVSRYQCVDETTGNCTHSPPRQFAEWAKDQNREKGPAKDPADEKAMLLGMCPKGQLNFCCDSTDNVPVEALAGFPPQKAKPVFDSNGRITQVVLCECAGTVENVNNCQQEHCSGDEWVPLNNYLRCKAADPNQKEFTGSSDQNPTKQYDVFLPDCYQQCSIDLTNSTPAQTNPVSPFDKEGNLVSYIDLTNATSPSSNGDAGAGDSSAGPSSNGASPVDSSIDPSSTSSWEIGLPTIVITVTVLAIIILILILILRGRKTRGRRRR